MLQVCLSQPKLKTMMQWHAVCQVIARRKERIFTTEISEPEVSLTRSSVPELKAMMQRHASGLLVSNQTQNDDAVACGMSNNW